MVDEFVRLGHTVFGCARTGQKIKELRCLYPNHDFQTVDVASDAQVKDWVERLTKQCGVPDFVVNNAAVINRKALLWDVKPRDFSDEIDINIKGVVNVIRCFTPAMIARRKGVIVNFISRWGKIVEKQMAPYCATKWAVVALTRALAAELKPYGIAAVALNPGVVKTGMLQRYLGTSRMPDKCDYVLPIDWARIAVPFILRLSLKDTGRSRNVLPRQIVRP
jgi:NAD(P)-dependent dehydrogenase (short-subunit alcohol dehydrogenase family)